MISIDKLSYGSNLRNINPIEKFMFALLTLALCIGFNNIATSIAILLLMSIIIVFRGKIALVIYIKLMLVPLAFLIVGVITIAINIIPAREALFSFSLFKLTLGVTADSLIAAAKLFSKCLASVSCLYFLALSTPIFEILYVLRKLKVPKLFVELMGLIYRFIFVLLETANMIFIAQSSRLGYNTFKTSFSSLGKLITSLFICAYKRSQDLYTAMEARCYDGEINLLEIYNKVSYRNLLRIILVELVIAAISTQLYRFS